MVSRPDVIVFMETWLIDSVFCGESSCDGYMVYKFDMCPIKSGKLDGGGVLIAVNTDTFKSVKFFYYRTPREESELKASATHIKNFKAFCISIQLVRTRLMLGGTRIALVIGTSNRRHCEICYEREALTYNFTSLK